MGAIFQIGQIRGDFHQIETMVQKPALQEMARQDAESLLGRIAALQMAEGTDLNDYGRSQLKALSNRVIGLLDTLKRAKKGEKTIFAEGNQYNLEGPSICTCAAYVFIQHFMARPKTELNPGILQQALLGGRANYNKRSLSAGQHLAFYDLHHPGQKTDLRTFNGNVEGTHWPRILQHLADARVGALGITGMGQSVAVVKRGQEWIIFDSHGNAEINNGRREAYAYCTTDRQKAAEFLHRALPITEDTMDIPELCEFAVYHY